ncbi:MAG: dihydroorotate dehydrogenase-like protein, partial [Chloroflexi bacterium]|nr:dihydroorotate dehydrogenase-like protein [Chloroflexota bacterium]
MPDLSTTYLGLNLSSPLVPSASPLSRSLDNIKRMEDAGAAAVVFYSLFEEQINHESQELDFYLSRGTQSFAEALTYFPEPREFTLTPDQYLEHVRQAKAAVSVPIIASLNGVSSGGWIKYARKIEEAGADALELNMYFVSTDADTRGDVLEDMYVDLLVDVQRTVKIPVAVKLSPFFTSLPHTAQRLVRAGARGLVLFNRFYQPDFDLEALEVVVRPQLSTLHTPQALRLPLRWIAILYNRLPVDFALTSGVHTAEDAIKGVMAGASITMMASELLKNGIGRLTAIKADMHRWLEDHEYESVTQMRGSMSQKSVAFPAAFERAHYMMALTGYELPNT